MCAEDDGGLAQLGEHLLCKQGVVGSIPSTSTKVLGFVCGVSVERSDVSSLGDVEIPRLSERADRGCCSLVIE